MKNFLKGMLVMLLIVTMSVGVLAATPVGNKTVSAILNSSIKVVVNNKQLEMKDSNGNVLLPITYNGTTYLPLRSIAESVGLPVNYEGVSQTAYLGSTDEKVMCTSADVNPTGSSHFIFTKDSSKLTVNNMQYATALVSKDCDWWLADTVGSYSLNLKLNKSTTKFGGTFYVASNTLPKGRVEFSIVDDTSTSKTVLYSAIVNPGEILDFEVDTFGASKIAILTVNNGIANYEIPAQTINTQFIGVLEPYYIY